jgi:hypothetical protein
MMKSNICVIAKKSTNPIQAKREVANLKDKKGEMEK